MIDKDSFILCAIQAYDNASCKTIEEFEEDIKKFDVLSRCCNKPVDKHRTINLLNLVTSMLNVFDHETCIKMMFFKVKSDNWYKLKTILVYMNRMPEKIHDAKLINSEVKLCQEMIDTLRTI